MRISRPEHALREKFVDVKYFQWSYLIKFDQYEGSRHVSPARQSERGSKALVTDFALWLKLLGTEFEN